MTQPPDQYAALIERAGLAMAREGLPRIAGRIFGLLLVTPHELGIDEMAERLAVSRASISTDARRLERLGIVERVGRGGDRKDYYRLAPNHHIRTLERRIESVAEFLALLDEAQRLPERSPAVSERLTTATTVCQDMMDIMAEGLERLRRRVAAARCGNPPR